MYLDALNSLLISGEYPPLFSVDELDSLLQVIWQRDNNIYHSRLIMLKIPVKPFKAYPHYAGGIGKRSFFLASSLLSTPIRHETQTCQNALQTGGIWQRSFFSQFSPTARVNPSRKRTLSKRSSNHRNLFLNLVLPSTLIRHKNGAWQNAHVTAGIW